MYIYVIFFLFFATIFADIPRGNVTLSSHRRAKYIITNDIGFLDDRGTDKGQDGQLCGSGI